MEDQHEAAKAPDPPHLTVDQVLALHDQQPLATQPPPDAATLLATIAKQNATIIAKQAAMEEQQAETQQQLAEIKEHQAELHDKVPSASVAAMLDSRGVPLEAPVPVVPWNTPWTALKPMPERGGAYWVDLTGVDIMIGDTKIDPKHKVLFDSGADSTIVGKPCHEAVLKHCEVRDSHYVRDWQQQISAKPLQKSLDPLPLRLASSESRDCTVALSTYLTLGDAPMALILGGDFIRGFRARMLGEHSETHLRYTLGPHH